MDGKREERETKKSRENRETRIGTGKGSKERNVTTENSTRQAKRKKGGENDAGK